MALTILTRPEKDIFANNPPSTYEESYYTSLWNSAGGRLPVIYKLESDKFPVNTFDDTDNITTVSDYSGYAQINLPGTYETYVELEYVKIEGSSVEAYNGVWQIIKINATTQIVINCAFSGTATGTIQRYYKNYQANVKVFVGIPGTHILCNTDPMTEIATLKVSPNIDNVAIVDVSAFLKAKLSLDFGIESENDTGKWTAFYIKYAESYDVSDGTEVTTHISEYTIDTHEGCSGEKITNGVFTGNINGWTNEGSGQAWAYGVNDARVQKSAGTKSQRLSQALTLNKGVSYTLSFDIANNSAPNALYYRVTMDYSFGIVELYNSSLATASQTISIDFAAAENDVTIGFEVTQFSPGIGSQYMGVDNVSIEANDCTAYLYGVNGVRQFRSPNGGNFGEYVINFNNQAYDNKFLSVFDSPVLFDGKYLDLTCIIPKAQFDIASGLLYCKLDVYNGSMFVRSEDKQITNIDDGVYRVRIDDIDYSEGDRVKARIYKLPGNIFTSGDNGTFDATSDPGGTPPNDWDLTETTGTGIIYDTGTVYSGVGSGLCAVASRLGGLPAGIVKRVFYNTTSIPVQANSVYKISAVVILDTADPDWVNNSYVSLLPVGYNEADCISVDRWNITSSDVSSPQWAAIETQFNTGANTSIQVGAALTNVAAIDPVLSIAFNIDNLILAGPYDWMSEEKTIRINTDCTNQSIHLRWINPLGGDEYWLFTAAKDYETSIESSRSMVKDPFNDWDSGFINNQTQDDNIDIEAYWTVTVRSQYLTLDQIKAIGGDRSSGSAGLIGSIRVTDISDIDNPITVLVDKRSLKVRRDMQKLYTIEFDIRYPRIEIQNQ